MQPINEELIEQIDAYIEKLFVPHDDALEQNLKDTEAAGLPAIAISPNQGRLLYILAKMAGAKRILEIGLLGGYSTTWFARALPEDGQIISLEMNPVSATVARKNLVRANVDSLVDIRVGRAGDLLDKMIEADEKPFDLIFIDADKTGYIGYLKQVMQLVHSGSIIMADNLIRHGDVMADQPADANAATVKEYNEIIASDPRLESILLPIVKGKVDGFSISIVK